MAAFKTEVRPGGFDFDNYARNIMLGEKGVHPPRATKTGTTIVGCIYKDGVVLGADTRATNGSIVADKNCEKIHYLAPNMYCCGAGTAADTEFTTNLISSKLELHRLGTGREARVVTAMTMLKQMLFRYIFQFIFKISRAYRCCACFGWNRLHRATSLHYCSPWLH